MAEWIDAYSKYLRFSAAVDMMGFSRRGEIVKAIVCVCLCVSSLALQLRSCYIVVGQLSGEL
jgi:hypothetical protein